MLPIRTLACLGALAALAPLPDLRAQGGPQATLSGRVIDAQSRDPLRYVIVTVTFAGQEVKRSETDAEGRFRIEGLPPQLVRVQARLIGYRHIDRSLNLYAGRVSNVEYTLEPSEVVLRDIVVEEAPPTVTGWVGFEERRRLGFGTFYDEADMERFAGRTLPDIVRGATGIRIIRGRTNEAFAVSNRRRVGGPGPEGNRDCFLQVVVDGMIYWTPDVGGEVTFRSGPPPDLSRFLSTRELAGMEVYAGMSGVPVEFRRDGVQCGTLVIWTRRGTARAPGN